MASRLPSTPPVLPGFTSVRPLGTGGFADVFLYEQQLPRRQVAVKVLLEDVVDEDVLRMFNAEADIMARLSSHPSILTIYEASVSSDGRPYLVMEHCPTSLTTRYRRERIPVPEVLHLGIRIGSALETAHRAGLLHRDIKPSNILVTAFGVPVLSDFGIAAAIGGHHDVFAMSVPWSAPEIVDESVSGSLASEVWSFGATLYSLLSGHSPFEFPGRDRNSREHLKTRIRAAAYRPVARDDVPQSLQSLLARTMSRRPVDRPDTIAEVVHDLRLVQQELGLFPTPHEIAEDEWATAAPLDLADATHRGPRRSTVDHTSRRPARRTVRERPMPAEADDDGILTTGTAPQPRVPLVAASVAGVVTLAAAVLIVLFATGAVS